MFMSNCTPNGRSDECPFQQSTFLAETWYQSHVRSDQIFCQGPWVKPELRQPLHLQGTVCIQGEPPTTESISSDSLSQQSIYLGYRGSHSLCTGCAILPVDMTQIQLLQPSFTSPYCQSGRSTNRHFELFKCSGNRNINVNTGLCSLVMFFIPGNIKFFMRI